MKTAYVWSGIALILFGAVLILLELYVIGEDDDANHSFTPGLPSLQKDDRWYDTRTYAGVPCVRLGSVLLGYGIV